MKWLKNWKTTLTGVLTIGTAVAHIATSGGGVDATSLAQIMAGLGLLFSKDFNTVGGGSKPIVNDAAGSTNLPNAK